MKRLLSMWGILGTVYVALETLWRGHSHPAMLIVGGLCGVLVGAVNQIPQFYKMPIVCQSLMGALIVLAVEFLSGCVLNLWLGLGIWDYSNLPFNIMGQICLLYGALWFLIMPLAIWLEDTLNWLLWEWDRLMGREVRGVPEIPPYSLGAVYWDFIRGR